MGVRPKVMVARAAGAPTAVAVVVSAVGAPAWVAVALVAAMVVEEALVVAVAVAVGVGVGATVARAQWVATASAACPLSTSQCGPVLPSRALPYPWLHP